MSVRHRVTMLILLIASLSRILVCQAQGKTLLCDPSSRGAVTCEVNQFGMCDTRGGGAITACTAASGQTRASALLARILEIPADAGTSRIRQYVAELTAGRIVTASGVVTFSPFSRDELGIGPFRDPSMTVAPNRRPADRAFRFCAIVGGAERCTSVVASDVDEAKTKAIESLTSALCGVQATATCRNQVLTLSLKEP